MSKIETIIDNLIENDKVIEFKIKSLKDGLIIVKSKLYPPGRTIEVHSIDFHGDEILREASTASKEDRNKMIVEMHERGYSQKELSLIFSISQSNINKIVKENTSIS